MAGARAGRLFIHALRDRRVDGKYVLLSSEMDLDAGEWVLKYPDVWRALRSMKTVLRVESVYHRAACRIVSQAHLCVLACLLMRIAENRVGESWALIREEVERVSVGRIEMDFAALFRVKRPKDSGRQIWNSCGRKPPPKTLQVTT